MQDPYEALFISVKVMHLISQMKTERILKMGESP